MFKLKQIFILLSFFILTVAGCSDNKSDSSVYDTDSYAAAPEESGIIENRLEKTKTDETRIDATIERKLTKHGTIRFQTDDTEKSRNNIASLTEQLNGYISSEHSSDRNQYTETALTIRIPAENFDKLLEGIESNAIKVDYKNVDVQDVTQRYIDLDTRIKTKKEVESRYRELLQKASNMDEILQIESQIGEIRTEIESAEGQLKYLAGQVNHSTLNVTFYKNVTKKFGFVQKMKNALGNGWGILLWVIVGLTNIWALILFIALLWYIIIKIKRYRRRRRNTKQ